jgi:hypothetical protein
MIPAPPAPAWRYWWHPESRQWFEHDRRVLAFVVDLQAAVAAGAAAPAGDPQES